MRKTLVATMIAALVLLTGIPARGQGPGADLWMKKAGGPFIGDNAYQNSDIGQIGPAQVLRSRVREKARFRACVYNETDPGPDQFYLKSEGDQRGWKATWYRDGSPLNDSTFEFNGSQFVAPDIGDFGCLNLKIKSTDHASRRAVWMVRAYADTLAGGEDVGKIIIKRRD